MTDKEFSRYSFRHSERIIFIWPVDKAIEVECMLLAVDFEQKLLKLLPFDVEIYDKKPFWSRCEYCRKSLRIKK